MDPTLLFRIQRRARRGRAVAHTTDGTCSVCHVALPPMLFQVLRRERKLDQCPHCNRIIYYKERGSEPAAPAPVRSRAHLYISRAHDDEQEQHDLTINPGGFLASCI